MGLISNGDKRLLLPVQMSADRSYSPSKLVLFRDVVASVSVLICFAVLAVLVARGLEGRRRADSAKDDVLHPVEVLPRPHFTEDFEGFCYANQKPDGVKKTSKSVRLRRGHGSGEFVADDAIPFWMKNLTENMREMAGNGSAMSTDSNSTANGIRIKWPKITRIRHFVEELETGSTKQIPVAERRRVKNEFSSAAGIVEKNSACVDVKRWAVMTSHAPAPTGPMKTILELGWCLVVIADEGSPESFEKLNNPRFVYLTLDDQLNLPFEVGLLTPRGSLSQKNLGYLYAIGQGAAVILDIDDDTEPIAVDEYGTFLPVEDVATIYERPFLYMEDHLDVIADLPVWNPYRYFNLTQTWPRGFPWAHLAAASKASTKCSMERVQHCLPVIQQYLVNIEPDVDAAYRMSRALPQLTVDYMDRKFKRLVSPRNVFAPYNAKATVHLKEAFWSLLLPTTVDDRVSDIWRSYITQSLLYLFPEACVMYTSPAVQRTPGRHVVELAELFKEEIPLYSRAAEFIEVIRNLPMKVDDISSAFLNVYKVLYETGFLEENDVLYAEAWLADLKKLGYQIQGTIAQHNGRRTDWLKETQLCILLRRGEIAPHISGELSAKYLPLFHSVELMVDGSVAEHVLSEHGVAKGDLLKLNNTNLRYFLAGNAEFWPMRVKSYLCPALHGYFQNRCLRMCLESAKSENKAVLYMQSDDYLNFEMITNSLPKDRIWYLNISHVKGRLYDENLYDDNSTGEYYVDDLRDAMEVLRRLPRDLKAAYEAHVNETGQVEGHVVPNFVYVPPTHRDRLAAVLDDIEKLNPDLYADTAVSLALNLLAPGDEKDLLSPQRKALYGRTWADIASLEEQLPRVMRHLAVEIGYPRMRPVWRDTMAEQYKWLMGISTVK